MSEKKIFKQNIVKVILDLEWDRVTKPILNKLNEMGTDMPIVLKFEERRNKNETNKWRIRECDAPRRC